MNTLLNWLVVTPVLLGCVLSAAETKPTIYEKYPDFLHLAHRTGGDFVITGETKSQDTREEYFKEDPGIVDRYITEGFRAKEVIDYISNYEGNDLPLVTYNMANVTLRDFVRCFSRDLAYYDPVLPEEKKRQAAQAIISALQARSSYEAQLMAGSPFSQSEPLWMLGFYYQMSPWRHRPEVIDYVRSVYPTLYGEPNKRPVEEFLALHDGTLSSPPTMAGIRPGPGRAFPIHPAAKSRADAASGFAIENIEEAASPDPAPALESIPPSSALPNAVATTSTATPAKPDGSIRWVFALAAVFAVVLLVALKKKRGVGN